MPAAKAATVIACALAQLLLAMLDGSRFATALRRNGNPGRIRLPDDPRQRAALTEAHIRGKPFTLTFCAEGKAPWKERVDAVVLAVYWPAADGRCRSIAVDLDGSDHGEGGLAETVAPMRTIAERADAFGLGRGLLAVRSRGGLGRHIFLILPEPVDLTDAAIGVAAIVAAAYRITATDGLDYGAPHAFQTATGEIAQPGEAGAVEMFPRSSTPPRCGWSLTLPSAGRFASRGGGVIVDPFADRPIELQCVPCCDQAAWRCLIGETRAELTSRGLMIRTQRSRQRSVRLSPNGLLDLDRLDRRTRAFLDGRTPEGSRNCAAFAATANLLGCGFDSGRAKHLILEGAEACGLPEPEALAAFRSAELAVARRGRV